MHLLVTQPGQVNDGGEAVDLDQSPGDIVILSAAASDLASFSEAHSHQKKDAPSLRLANLMQLSHNMSVDVYVEKTLANAKLIVVRLLGGVGYWPYGIDQISTLAREHGIKLAIIPGDEAPDPELTGYSTLAADACHRLDTQATGLRNGDVPVDDELREQAHAVAAHFGLGAVGIEDAHSHLRPV